MSDVIVSTVIDNFLRSSSADKAKETLNIDTFRTTLPTPTYTSYSGKNQTFVTEKWDIATGQNFSGSNQNLKTRYVAGFFNIWPSSPSLQIADFTGYTSGNACSVNGSFRDAGVFFADFVSSANSVDLMANTVSVRFKTQSSGVISSGLRYKFTVNFAANEGDIIVMSPSGHTFIVDKTITDATVFTSTNVGGVYVRSITSAGTPSGTDTSLTVNGGSTITTTLSVNSATNTSTMPESILFPSSTGYHVWNKTFSSLCRFNIIIAE